jgi:EpsI family protein
VMMLLFWIGGRWREDLDKIETVGAVASGNVSGPAASIGPSRRKLWLVAVTTLVLAAIWQPLLAKLDVSDNSAPVRFPPIVGTKGWVAISDDVSDWRPDLSGARAEHRQTFVKADQRVGLYIAFYRGQTPQAKAITSSNELVHTTNTFWRLAVSGRAHAETGAGPLDVRTGVVVSQRARLAVWQWYWVDGRATSNDYVAKLYQAMSVLEGRGDPVAWVIVYTPTETDEQDRAALRAFTADMREAIDSTLREAAAQ